MTTMKLKCHKVYSQLNSFTVKVYLNYITEVNLHITISKTEVTRFTYLLKDNPRKRLQLKNAQKFSQLIKSIENVHTKLFLIY